MHPPALWLQDKLFKSYVEMELQLGNIDRCRTLYTKYIEWAPANAAAWGRFADLERSLGEAERARAVYELAIGQPVLDMPEVLWKVRPPWEGACGWGWGREGGALHAGRAGSWAAGRWVEHHAPSPGRGHAP